MTLIHGAVFVSSLLFLPPPFCPSRPAVDKLLDSPVTLSSKILFYFWRVGGEEQMDDRLLYKLFNKCIYFIAGEKHLIACLLA